MDKVLESLLEAAGLTEDTAARIREAFDSQITEAVEAAKQEATDDVRAELTEEWIKDRDQLIEAVDSKVTDFITAEFEEMRADIENFRDLEVEAADKLVEARAEMAAEVKGDLVELVEKLDSFLQIRIAAEFDELREDLQEVRKIDTGRRIIEAFQEEVMDLFAVDDDTDTTVAELKTRANDLEAALEESETKRAAIERTIKMEEVLAPLSGRSRDVMEAILKTVDTSQLVEGYTTFIGRVVRETTDDDLEKENKVLAEGTEVDTDNTAGADSLVTGDDEGRLIEEAVNTGSGLTEAEKQKLQKIAGIR